MRVVDVIRGSKRDVQTEAWHSGKIPPSAWSFSHHWKGIDHSKKWEWRIIKFSLGGQNFRILIELLLEKAICSISLAIEADEFVRTICVHEYQAGSEPGWHCHAVFRCSQGIRYRDHRGILRYPKCANFDEQFGLDRDGVMRLAVRFFRLETTGDLL
jgi:hypothetical protein